MQNALVLSDEQFQRLVAHGRGLLDAGGGIEDVIVLAHGAGLPFSQCVRLLTRLGVGLAEAKPLVHSSRPYAETRQDREEFWEDLHQAAVEAVALSEGTDSGSPGAD